MNNTTLIKLTSSAIAIATATLFSSCVQPVGQQQQGATTPQQSGPNTYAVPGLNGQTPEAPVVGIPSYPQTPGTAPYQPLPGVPGEPTDPAVLPTPAPVTPSNPASGAPTQPSAGAAHDVVAGETLWRISRKYGVTVDALKNANGLQNDTIWAGQKLIIPAGN